MMSMMPRRLFTRRCSVPAMSSIVNIFPSDNRLPSAHFEEAQDHLISFLAIGNK
jgi:hypothetical protein